MNNPSDTPTPQDEQLVAYLDGELDAEGRERLESQLATDTKLRARLQSLERTWEMLDELDTAPVGEPFTHTTLEMVALAAGEEVERENSDAPRKKRRWWIMSIILLTASVAAGFASVALFTPDPNTRLLEDLPLLERFDSYRYVESVEFLETLRDKGMFAETDGKPESVPALIAADSSAEQRRRFLAAMSPDEKEQLRTDEERFDRLPDEERWRRRRLHEELRADSDAERLETILNRYYAWLTTLPPYNRAELTEMESGKRVKWIENRLRREERRKIESLLTGDDVKKIWKWAFDYIEKYEKQITKSLPEAQRKRLEQFSPQMRRKVLFGMILHYWRDADPKQPSPFMTDDDLARLREQLSGAAHERLDKMTPDQQWKTAALWLSMRPGGGFRGRRGEPTKADDDRLAEFFEKELSRGQRDRLLGLPPDEMRRELYHLFLTRERQFHGPHHRNGGKNPEKRNKRHEQKKKPISK